MGNGAVAVHIMYKSAGVTVVYSECSGNVHELPELLWCTGIL